MKLWGYLLGVATLSLMAPPALATDPRALVPGLEYVAVIEINTYGPDPGRCAVLFWDTYRHPVSQVIGLNIVDYRMCRDDMKIETAANGMKALIWTEGGWQREVRATQGIKRTRTENDVELKERAFLPAGLRRKLIPLPPEPSTPPPAPMPAPPVPPLPAPAPMIMPLPAAPVPAPVPPVEMLPEPELMMAPAPYVPPELISPTVLTTVYEYPGGWCGYTATGAFICETF